MSKLTVEVKEVFSQMNVIPVATASKNGLPNVVPLSFVKVYDDETILLADNFMNKSSKNLEENPQISVCAWDLEKKQAYQVKGQASVIKS